jgi:hypothetical protein
MENSRDIFSTKKSAKKNTPGQLVPEEGRQPEFFSRLHAQHPLTSNSPKAMRSLETFYQQSMNSWGHTSSTDGTTMTWEQTIPYVDRLLLHFSRVDFRGLTGVANRAQKAAEKGAKGTLKTTKLTFNLHVPGKLSDGRELRAFAVQTGGSEAGHWVSDWTTDIIEIFSN